MSRLYRKVVVSLVLTVVLMASFSALSFAAGNSAEFVIGLNQYFINDQLPGTQMDAAAYIDPASGRTLVPVRYLADALGATTAWDGTTQTVTVSNSAYNIQMAIGSTTLTVDGQTSQMDVAPLINNGRTYLPARYVAEALGYDVGWDATDKIVIIYPTSNIGVPAYNIVIQQAQQNAATPAQVKKLESALGITMTGSAADGGWDYNPEMNADGSPNIAWENQNMSNSFVVAGYEPVYKDNSSELDVRIECATLVGDPNTVSNVDISPLQEVLEAFIPCQDADIQQMMAYAQKCEANAKAYHGFNPLPAFRMTINGMTVGVGQGDGNTFANIEIYGS